MHPALLYRLLKPVLFSLDPETAHDLVAGPSKALLSLPGGAAYLRATLGYSHPSLAVNCSGISFPGPVGMAAGFDKTGTLYPFLSAAGFDFVESGTFTPLPQEGNPRPRLFRFPKQGVLINRMGFNNPGMDDASAEFARQDASISSTGPARKQPRGINIGKNKVTPNDQAIQDYLKCFKLLQSHADYVAINISSPNTPNLRDLQSTEFLKDLLFELNRARESLNSSVPVFVKLAPDISDQDLAPLTEAALEGSAAGLILTNTTISRELPGTTDQMRETMGGLSGHSLFDRSTELLEKAREIAGPNFALIGVGGIDSPVRALHKILSGANLVQIYSGYIFRGPTLPAKINRFLQRVCAAEECTVSDLVGKKKEFYRWLQSS
ncbi:MAG: dihydroorotate dehydrogenase (quinone) [Spirochaetaceae bacterium]|nr:dihydroorotate dehydrogenase (quinone) [Spirochaetaceae bacterium]|tara:strand:+ start:76914 stop:78053 length:1140 start_codon:yes stop_codon:yes gene_type:complete